MIFKKATENRSICIVASTLPAGFISACAGEFEVVKIVVTSSNLEISYNSLKTKNSNIEIVLAPSGVLAQSIYYFSMLLLARLRGFRIIIFHECCLTILDLLLMLIRPRGNYLPLSTMSEWEEVTFSQFKKTKMAYLINFLKLTNSFKYYRTPGVGGNETENVISIKRYPKSIIAMNLPFARDKSSLAARNTHQYSKNVLFLTGKSFVPDAVQIKLYTELIDIAISMGYICSVKDHPNPVYRLNFTHEDACFFDPFTPAELLEDDFFIVVGVSSTALLSYGKRSVSLVKMITEMTAVDRDACIKSYDVLTASGCKMRYVSSTDDFRTLLFSRPCKTSPTQTAQHDST
jgi:hypothetical protein